MDHLKPAYITIASLEEPSEISTTSYPRSNNGVFKAGPRPSQLEEGAGYRARWGACAYVLVRRPLQARAEQSTG